MESTLVLKRRIQAAQNVSKTTRAMQMIAAAKLKKVQTAAVSMKPYVEKLSSLTKNVATKIDPENAHPYMHPKNVVNKTLLIALSPDKGLCGGLITNLIREFLHYQKHEKNSTYIVIGKKIEAKVAHLRNEVLASFSFGTSTPAYDLVFPILHIIDDYYLNQKVDSVKILSTNFISIFTQSPKITTLLPITLPETNKEVNESFHIFEPKVDEILPSLLKHYLEMTLYSHLLESFASEQASRMITMQNATDNAKDIIEGLRLEYNKSRQAKITSEILDISSSSGAQKYE